MILLLNFVLMDFREVLSQLIGVIFTVIPNQLQELFQPVGLYQLTSLIRLHLEKVLQFIFILLIFLQH